MAGEGGGNPAVQVWLAAYNWVKGYRNPDANDQHGVKHRIIAATVLGTAVSRRESRAVWRAWEGKDLNSRQQQRLVNVYQRSGNALPGSGGNPNTGGSWSVGGGWAPWLAYAYDWWKGPRGPRTRGRKRKKITRRPRKPDWWNQKPPILDPYGGDGISLCGTDSQCADWDLAHGTGGLPGSAFVPPTIPDVLPPSITIPPWLIDAVAKTLRRPGTIIGVLWPNRTADDDVIYPLPAPEPRGPRRRYPNKRPTTTDWPVPDFDPGTRPRKPRKPLRIRVPQRAPSRTPQPAGVPVPQPPSVPRPTPQSVPQRTPARTPSPTTRTPPSPSVPRVQDWLGPLLLSDLLKPGAQRGRVRLPQQSPFPIEAPLTSPFAYGVGSPPRTDRCDCTTKRKRKKSSCTNPVSSKRTFTRGGTRYRTITRKLKCPA